MRLAFLSATALIALCASAAVSQTVPSRVTPAMLRELGPQWWRWRVSLPAMAVPDKDTVGHFCDVGQSKSTWFLGGLLSFGRTTEPLRRTCRVPAGRRLFFPVVTLLRIVYADATCSKAQAQVSAGIDGADHLNATLDGVDIPAADRVRWGSDRACFRLDLPADGPSSALTAAADGYWLLLNALPAGHHTLVYGGALPADPTDQARVQATTYDLEVE